MKFSTKTRYGIRAMVEIALQDKGNGVFQKDIAKNQDISNKYLDHIIHALKVAGLICNVGGKKSGYILTRKSKNISMYDIHKAFEPGICIIECLTPRYKCKREKGCLTRGFWKKLNSQVEDYLKSVSLDDLINDQEQFAQ